jgi:hypothetical protein
MKQPEQKPIVPGMVKPPIIVAISVSSEQIPLDLLRKYSSSRPLFCQKQPERKEAIPPPPANDWPAYWLVCLERAISEGEYTAAAHAQQELRRLGIDVTMRLLPRREVET